MVNGKNSNENNGNFAATSVEAWDAYNSEIIQLSDRLAIEIAGYDVLALLLGGTNPVLAIIQGMVERDEKGQPQLDKLNEAALMKDPDKLKELSKALDQLLIDIVISPRLKQQGFEDGYSLARIPFNYKMRVFEHISGGEQALTAAERFHQTEATSLVVAQPSEGLRTETESN